MGQRFKKYWTNVSEKPKGFKFIKRNIYEYQVPFRVYNTPNPYTIYRELVPIYYIPEKYGHRKIDTTKLVETLEKKFNIIVPDDGGYFDRGIFRRDAINCPFVECITVPIEMTERYLEHRVLRQRLLKINKLKRKFNV